MHIVFNEDHYLDNASVPILEVQSGDIEADLILGISAAAETDLENRKSHHDGFDDHEHDDFETFSVSIPTISDLESFKMKMKKLINENEVLRVKGFLRVENKPLKLIIQAVGKRLSVNFTDTKTTNESIGTLVFIGEKEKINQKIIEAQFLSSQS